MSEQADVGSRSIVILLPNYNDWESVLALLPRIDSVLGRAGMAARVLVVDDGSDVAQDETAFAHLQLENIGDVGTIELVHNLGNQRAIATGISYVAETLPCDYLVVMDSDHQDDPEYIPRLIGASAKRGKMVFAERSQRSEGLVFRVFYLIYRVLFRLLTGVPISIGNFSVIPGRTITRVASISGLWSHYPSSVMKARVPLETITSVRSHRYAGQSSMRFVSLIMHGFTSFAIQADVVVARTFVTLLALTVLVVLGGLATLVFQFLTEGVVPSWAFQFLGLLLILFFQTIIMAFILLFVVLTVRNHRSIIPIRDYHDFILSVKQVFPGDESEKSADGAIQAIDVSGARAVAPTPQ